MTEKYFDVHDSEGRVRTVLANDGDHAVDQYFVSLESWLCHTLKICACFGKPKRLDREIVARPIKVVDHDTGQVVRTLLYPELKNQGWPEDNLEKKWPTMLDAIQKKITHQEYQDLFLGNFTDSDEPKDDND